MNKPTIEALKEIARWAICIAAGWVITETLNQITAVPESAVVKIWVFTYALPIRMLLQTALTFAGRAIDKYIFVKNKETMQAKTTLLEATPKGLIWF